METIERLDAKSAQSVAEALSRIDNAKGRFLRTFSFVPDDKLNWTPSPTSKSALRIAAHLAVTNGFLEGPLRGQPLPPMTLEQAIGKMGEMELAIVDRAQAITAIESSTASCVMAIEGITPEILASEAHLPFGDIPMIALIGIIAGHFLMHSGQVDYLQTIWGDLDPHFA